MFLKFFERLRLFFFECLDIAGNGIHFIRQSHAQTMKDFNQLKSTNRLVRIVFLIMLNGRSLRQILRLVKTIYDEKHFYYFHVDKVSF